MRGLLIGLFCGMSIVAACGWGSKKMDYDDFPKRSNDNTVWLKCKNDYKNVCKNICLEYTKKNVCKKKKTRIEKLDIKKALDSGYIFMSKSMFIELLKKK